MCGNGTFVESIVDLVWEWGKAHAEGRIYWDSGRNIMNYSYVSSSQILLIGICTIPSISTRKLFYPLRVVYKISINVCKFSRIFLSWCRRDVVLAWRVSRLSWSHGSLVCRGNLPVAWALQTSELGCQEASHRQGSRRPRARMGSKFWEHEMKTMKCQMSESCWTVVLVHFQSHL